MSESGEVLKEALQTARSEADILDALAGWLAIHRDWREVIDPGELATCSTMF